uniref:Secreted protein n=1 Tax=Ixodes ricinus TaxID=34613 RepID=A0A6B0UT30_IXORI
MSVRGVGVRSHLEVVVVYFVVHVVLDEPVTFPVQTGHDGVPVGVRVGRHDGHHVLGLDAIPRQGREPGQLGLVQVVPTDAVHEDQDDARPCPAGRQGLCPARASQAGSEREKKGVQGGAVGHARRSSHLSAAYLGC